MDERITRVIQNINNGEAEGWCVSYKVESAPILEATHFEIIVMAESAPTVEDALVIADSKALIEKVRRYNLVDTAFPAVVESETGTGSVTL